MREVSVARPFFDASLHASASDGSGALFRPRRRVAVFDDRIEIDGRAIAFGSLRDLRVYGNVLHVEYLAPGGRPVTEYFAYDAFHARSGERKLKELVERVGLAILHSALPCPRAGDPRVILAEVLAPSRGRQVVAVYSSRVAFPPSCPTCRGEVSTVAILPAAPGLSHRGSWLVPACSRHPEVTAAIHVEFWRGDASEVRLSFANPDYARDFFALNSVEDREEFRQCGTASRLAFDLQTGSQYVVYRYVLSLGFVSFRKTSRVLRIGAERSRVLAGLPFTLLSLLAGWWAIPAGPLVTLAAVVGNFRGGTDVSDRVIAVLCGESHSALGI